ncbi:MAG: hypothetical protein QOE14_504 [Humisphaera sp.]|nr:hypothetical protein [Humisphaera sp.]
MGSHRCFIFTASMIAALAVAGCKSAKRSPANDADRQASDFRRHAKWDEQPTGITQEPVAVAQGTTPLVYLFDIGGPIRVVDLTTKSRLVAADVPNRTLVRVDDRNGVTVGKENLMPGPLPPGHTYGIYLDPTTPNVYRQGIGPPGDVPR